MVLGPALESTEKQPYHLLANRSLVGSPDDEGDLAVLLAFRQCQLQVHQVGRTVLELELEIVNNLNIE
jgi:hypothetical protein